MIKMKILIDNSNLNAGGGIQVATSFLYDLQSISENNLYYVVQSLNSAKQIKKKDFDDRFHFYDLNTNKISIIKRSTLVRKIEKEVQPDVIFTVFGPSYHKSHYTKIVGFALGQILYPSSPYFKKSSFIEFVQVKLISKLKSLFFQKNSDVLIYETNDANLIYSRINNYKIKGYTVSNTVNNVFFNSDNWEEISIEKSSFDVLYLCANYPHKNISIIPKVIDEILNDGRLTDFRFHLSVSKSELKFEDKYDKYINYLGKVEIKEIPLLFKEMDILFMPTLLETFSTTYLEAMVSKKPIVTSNLGFAKDICGDAALFIDPLDAKESAMKISSLYFNKVLYNDLVQKGTENLKRFGTSMDRTKKYLEILKKYANAGNQE